MSKWLKSALWKFCVKLIALLCRLPFFIFSLTLFKLIGLLDFRQGLGGPAGFLYNIFLFSLAWVSGTIIAHPLVKRGKTYTFYSIVLLTLLLDVILLWINFG